MHPSFLDALVVTIGAAVARVWMRRRAAPAVRRHSTRSVAVFDAGLPTGIAFIRSLGRAGTPVVVYGHERLPTGRFSRYVSEFRPAPSVYDTDRFVDWLSDEIAKGRIDLIAPTSDYIAFNVAAAYRRLGIAPPPGNPSDATLNDCLFKERFCAAISQAGFPTPVTRAPATPDDAALEADTLGYPVLLKPRSHIGIGIDRGRVVHSESELRAAFVPYEIGAGHEGALAVDSDLALPLVQQYFHLGTVDVISVSGMLGPDGTVLALTHSSKTHQWPPRVGIGTQFTTVARQPFTDAAIAAVRAVLGSGLFELEILVNRSTGEYWAIDLNPRGFGQMALDIAAGHDLPRLWYDTVTGKPARAEKRPPAHAPRIWRMGVHYYAGVVVRAVSGRVDPDADAAHHVQPGSKRVGPVWDRRDPVPGLVWAYRVLRHPGGLIRPYLRDREPAATPARPEIAWPRRSSQSKASAS